MVRDLGIDMELSRMSKEKSINRCYGIPMRHLKKKKKLNMSSSHRRSFLRNQVLHLIRYGHITTTLRVAKAVRSFAEKVVTIAAKGNDFNRRRRVKQLLPYNDQILVKLFKDIAPHYTDRAGGYTRIFRLGNRISDTAKMARLQWV